MQLQTQTGRAVLPKATTAAKVPVCVLYHCCLDTQGAWGCSQFIFEAHTVNDADHLLYEWVGLLQLRQKAPDDIAGAFFTFCRSARQSNSGRAVQQESDNVQGPESFTVRVLSVVPRGPLAEHLDTLFAACPAHLPCYVVCRE
jgi:hypothetical protein